MNCAGMMVNPHINHEKITTERKAVINELRKTHPSFSKQLKLIEEQHDVTEVAYAGEGFF